MHYIRSVKKRPVSVLARHCEERTVRRSNLLIKWEIAPPHSALLAMTDVILLNCNVEVVVYGLGQITKQRIYIVPNIIDRVIGIN